MLNQRKKIDKYMIHLDKKLGVGSFGTVYIGFQDGTQEKVAIKMLDKKTIEKDEYIKSALLAEIEILKTLKSENIVGFLDVMESTNNYYIVQEYCDGGDLRNLINKRGPLPQAQAIEMIAQVCNGFVELLRQGVIHRDLKPENILLNHNQKVIKICDFGFSKKSNNQRLKNNTIVGTPLYMPIQILKGQAYTSKCDIWALGFIFYELIHGIPPWDAESEYKLIQNIEHQPVKFSIPISPITKDFISRCLAVKERDRMSWDELLRHQMFNGKFAKVVKEKHQFENKLKTLMGKLRYQINSQNIQLEKLIQKHGLNFAKEMEFSAFQKFMKTIDPDILQQEIRYIFQKLDRDDSNTISLAELETAMVQNNIPLKSHYNFSKKQSISQKGIAAPDHDFTMIEKRVLEAFLRLDQKLKSRKITLLEVFDAYDVNKDGDISLDEFKRIMKRLDSSMGQEDVKMAFQMIDIDSSQTITFEQFNGFYIKCIMGKPISNGHSKANYL